MSIILPILNQRLIGSPRTCDHLELLAIATNITQGSNTRLYHVVTTLGNLYHIYSNPHVTEDVCNAIQGSLEKHWAAADQAPFLAALVLNPYLRGSCFSHLDINLTPIGLCNMLKQLHLRCFRQEAGMEFQSTFMDYYNQHNEFSPEFMSQDSWEETVRQEVCLLLVLVMDDFLTPGL